MAAGYLLTGSLARKIEMKREPDEIVLVIGTFSGVVLALVIAIELHVLTHREQTADIQIGCTPLFVLAPAEGFGGNVWDQMIARDRDSSLQGQLVAIAPAKSTSLPIEIRAISVRNKRSKREWEMKRHAFDCTVCRCPVRRGDNPISTFENYRSFFHVIEVEERGVFMLSNGCR